jgi:hypothetical protein
MSGAMTGEPARLASLRNARPTIDTFEVWLGRGLRAEGAPAAQGC